MGLKSIIILFLFYTLAKAQYSETDAQNYVDEANEKLFGYHDELAALSFGKSDNEVMAHMSEFNVIVNKIAELTKRAQNFNPDNYKDSILKRSLYNIKRSANLLISGEEFFEKTLGLTALLEMTYTQNTICEYQHTGGDCRMAYVPDVRRIISHFNGKPEELQYYWEEWRNGNIFNSRTFFPSFIEALKLAANHTDVSPLEFWYQDYGSEAGLLDEMEKVMTQIKPFYQLIHAFVRYELSIIYGDKYISEKGPIPHHFIELILLQAWKKDGVLEQSYPHKKLPNLKSAMDEHGLKGIENIIDSADEFYKSLGLKPLPSNIRSTNFVKKTEKDGPECKANIFDDTPNIRIEYCMQANFKKFLQMHGWMGRIYYANQKKHLPFAFYKSYNLEEAFGEACILSASTPKHIKEIGILPNYQYTQQHLLNRLFRMGVHTWFNIPIYFVHAKVMNDLLANKVSTDSVNDYYWKLMEEYVGVEPPVDRTKMSFDFSYKFYEDLEENHQTTKFMSEVMGYQMYKAICEKSGQYVKTNPLQYPLHNCDFYGFSEIGKNLTKMMELGSKEPWRQVLSTITHDNNGLSGQPLLDYYEPLRVWLEENIKVNKIFVGWEPSKRVLDIPVDPAQMATSMLSSMFGIMAGAISPEN